MIQGGDPKSKDASKENEWGTGDPGYKIKAEFNDPRNTSSACSHGALSERIPQEPASSASGRRHFSAASHRIWKSDQARRAASWAIHLGPSQRRAGKPKSSASASASSRPTQPVARHAVLATERGAGPRDSLSRIQKHLVRLDQSDARSAGRQESGQLLKSRRSARRSCVCRALHLALLLPGRGSQMLLRGVRDPLRLANLAKSATWSSSPRFRPAPGSTTTPRDHRRGWHHRGKYRKMHIPDDRSSRTLPHRATSVSAPGRRATGASACAYAGIMVSARGLRRWPARESSFTPPPLAGIPSAQPRASAFVGPSGARTPSRMDATSPCQIASDTGGQWRRHRKFWG
jgi:hypothetical protein